MPAFLGTAANKNPTPETPAKIRREANSVAYCSPGLPVVRLNKIGITEVQ